MQQRVHCQWLHYRRSAAHLQHVPSRGKTGTGGRMPGQLTDCTRSGYVCVCVRDLCSSFFARPSSLIEPKVVASAFYTRIFFKRNCIFCRCRCRCFCCCCCFSCAVACQSGSDGVGGCVSVYVCVCIQLLSIARCGGC